MTKEEIEKLSLSEMTSSLEEKIKRIVMLELPRRNVMEKKEFKLCYIEDGRAFFTTQDVEEQWGDDWDDAPYEYNAGHPYNPGMYHYSNGESKPNDTDWNEDGTPKWEIMDVMFNCSWVDEPREGHLNSPYSVQQINNKEIAWLRNEHREVYLYAGATLEEFESFVKELDGSVYHII